MQICMGIYLTIISTKHYEHQCQRVKFNRAERKALKIQKLHPNNHFHYSLVFTNPFKVMPVTIKPSNHGANALSNNFAADSKNILKQSLPSTPTENYLLLQSSFDDNVSSMNITPRLNGVVHACIDAYNNHQHLSLRPEDIWFTILTQISSYINKHAKELRGKFVAHKGKKELAITYSSGNRWTVDFGDFAMQISKLLQSNVVDPDLRQWIMPNFSTTTETDNVVASILMMASMQSYFSYGGEMLCGLPSITLHGEKADWELLLAKLEKLNTLGDQPIQFAKLLRPIISRFIQSFDDPKATEVIDFWQQIFSKTRQGSGLKEHFSGWITAFCFWDEKGNCMYCLPDTDALTIDGIQYPIIRPNAIPPGWSKVPVTVNDNGDKFQAQMFAGCAGYSCSSSGQPMENGMVGLDTICPQAGWWMFQDNSENKEGSGSKKWYTPSSRWRAKFTGSRDSD